MQQSLQHFFYLLKECKQVTNERLVSVFRKLLESSEVPVMWRQANVFLKGDKSLAFNYIPVSLTLVVCKILESIIQRNIREHLNKHNLINKTQHDFTKGKSCLTNFFFFFFYIGRALVKDNKNLIKKMPTEMSVLC